jgi:hypothetical protein
MEEPLHLSQRKSRQSQNLANYLKKELSRQADFRSRLFVYCTIAKFGNGKTLCDATLRTVRIIDIS